MNLLLHLIQQYFYMIELPLTKTETKSDPFDNDTNAENNEGVDERMCLADTSMPADDLELDEDNSTTAEEVVLRDRLLSGIHGFDSFFGIEVLFVVCYLFIVCY